MGFEDLPVTGNGAGDLGEEGFGFGDRFANARISCCPTLNLVTILSLYIIVDNSWKRLFWQNFISYCTYGTNCSESNYRMSFWRLSFIFCFHYVSLECCSFFLVASFRPMKKTSATTSSPSLLARTSKAMRTPSISAVQSSSRFFSSRAPLINRQLCRAGSLFFDSWVRYSSFYLNVTVVHHETSWKHIKFSLG